MTKKTVGVEDVTDIIEVKLDTKGQRRFCMACDSMIEKGEVRGLVYTNPGFPVDLCCECIASGDLPDRLRRGADAYLEHAGRHATWIRVQANRVWQLPTKAEVKAAIEAYWKAEAEKAGVS